MRGFGEVGGVHIGHKAEGHVAPRVVAQGFVGHYRPQVRTADADVDHIPNSLAGEACPGATANGVAELRHPVEHGMDVGHDVMSIHQDRGIARRAQRDVQNGTILGDVDALAAEHCVDAFAQAALTRELHE